MNVNLPLVSVYIVTKDRENLLKRSVESVLSQTYKNIEIIIVNDGSKDETGAYLTRLGSENNRVSIISNPQSLGACESRNKAILSSNGVFVTGLDDDDYFSPDRVEKFVFTWRALTKVDFLFSGRYLLDGDRIVGLVDTLPRSVSVEDLIYENVIGNQVFIKTNLFKKILFDPEFEAWQDFECWYRMLKNGYVGKSIKTPTYYLDISDRLDRISRKKKDIIKNTYRKFCEKHELGLRKRSILRVQLLSYGLEKMSWSFCAKTILASGDFKLFQMLWDGWMQWRFFDFRTKWKIKIKKLLG